MTAGIQRIKITDTLNGRGADRFESGKPYWSRLDRIYQAEFNLLSDIAIEECHSEEKLARLDIEFGVDVILTQINGMTCTVQEKVLRTTFDTVTVEYYQNPLTQEKGDWFNLKCDFYMVGYQGRAPKLRQWILLDWNQLRLASNNLPWGDRQNQNDGARASFRYIPFWDIPDICIIAKWCKPYRGARFNVYKGNSNAIPAGTQLSLLNA